VAEFCQSPEDGNMNRRAILFIAAVVSVVALPLFGSVQAQVPPVVLSKEHEALCKVRVGDAMPNLELPRLGAGSAPAKLADLSGEKGTVIVFWRGDRRMAREQLADMAPDVMEPFADKGIGAIGIAVDESSQEAQATLQKAKASFVNLLDAGGKAFAQFGRQKLPRTYVVDANGKIVWFDIEYSHATRRELKQAIKALVGESAATKE
jgi:peroxiredoxin